MSFSEPPDEVDRRQTFVGTARALADETGSAAFTVAQLTTRAGLSLKAFYACFQSKDDLLLALLGEESRLGAEVLAGIIGKRSGPSTINAYVSGLFAMLAPKSAVGYAGVLVREYRRLIEFHDDELRDAVAPLVDLLASDIDSDDPKRDAAHDVRGSARRNPRRRRRARHRRGGACDLPRALLYTGSRRAVTATFLPEPEPRLRDYTIISVDDHLIEPAHCFEGRLPAALQERAPHVVTLDDGRETWIYEDGFYPQVGLNAVAGRPKAEWSMEPARFDEMRRGCYDIEARVADMDLDGVYATLCFPSLIAGFAGTIFAKSDDAELGLATLRAWNDWHIEEWAGPHPDRVIPLQLAWINDPEIAAADVRAQRRTGIQSRQLPREPVRPPAPAHDRHLLGSVPPRVRGDGDGRLPP